MFLNFSKKVLLFFKFSSFSEHSIVLISVVFPQSINLFSNYGFKLVDLHSFGSFLDFLVNSYLGGNKWFGPYWFFWMILGTYLVMPIFNKWIYHSSLKEVEYFLIIWLFLCIYMYTLNFKVPIFFKYFTGPIGMVVLGYYPRYSEKEIFNKLWFSILLILIGAVSDIVVSYLNSSTSNLYFVSRYSIFLTIEVIGIFLLFKNIDKKNIEFFNSPNSIFRKVSFAIAKYSYGIYLVHQVFMNLLIILLIPYTGYKLLIALLFIGTLGISYFVLYLFNKIPYINKVIGIK